MRSEQILHTLSLFKEVFYLIHKALSLVVLCRFNGITKLTKQILLLFGKVFGDFHVYLNILITPCTTSVKLWNALVLKTEHRACLSSLGDVVLNISVNGGNLNLGTECRFNKGNGEVTHNVIALTGKQLVLFNTGNNQQISCRSAVFARIALTAYRNNLLVVDTCRDFHLDLTAFTDTAIATTSLAGIGNNLTRTRTSAAWSCTLEVSERSPLNGCNLTCSVTYITGRRCTAAFRTAAAAGIAALGTVYVKLNLAAKASLLKGEVNRIFKVTAALGSIGVASCLTAAKAATEKAAEYIFKAAANTTEEEDTAQ